MSWVEGWFLGLLSDWSVRRRNYFVAIRGSGEAIQAHDADIYGTTYRCEYVE